jgi:hypothetical protein
MPETTSRPQPLFETPEERAIYLFGLIVDDKRATEGDAEFHARTAKTGLWGDKRLLARDCAIIFASELLEVMEELGWESPELGPGGVLFQAVLAVPKFGRLVELWRREVEWETENELRKELKQGELPPLGELREEDTALLSAPYDEIHTQIMEMMKGWTYLG